MKNGLRCTFRGLIIVCFCHVREVDGTKVGKKRYSVWQFVFFGDISCINVLLCLFLYHVFRYRL